MKQWKKTIHIASAVLAICVAAAFLFGNRRECCLCNSPSYSAPCLIDLKTGYILELNLDGPSSTHTPSNGQSDVKTFSFIQFGNITGIKQTAPGIIELKIPTADKTNTPALCSKCCKLLPREYDERYVLADLVSGTMFPFIAGEIMICGAAVTVTQKEEHIYAEVCAG